MRLAVLGFSILGLAALAGGLVVHGGWIDVAASRRHPQWVETILPYAMERSVRRHARGIPAPGIAGEKDAEAGLVHYRAMCETCHGAPGEPPSEIAEGLYPRPPQLAEAGSDRTDAELFWIAKHGIQMTGMPGFGATHSDDELWEIVAVVKRLPDMDPQSYRATGRMDPTPAPSDDHHDHPHQH
jgi:mono/diheme cytochrome c family protein